MASVYWSLGACAFTWWQTHGTGLIHMPIDPVDKQETVGTEGQEASDIAVPRTPLLQHQQGGSQELKRNEQTRGVL